jgi:hypothetical protein
MRLVNPSFEESKRDELERFSNWILAIGDGTAPTERKGDEREASWVIIPDDLLIHTDGVKLQL